MSILSGFFKTKKYRKTDTGYQLQSEWTSASTVEMADGNTAETNLGAIQGITDSLTATSSNIALSAKGANDMYNELNSNLSTKTFLYETTVSANALWQVSLGKLSNITNGEITPDTFCGVTAYYGGYAFDTFLATNGNLYVGFRTEITISNVPMRFVIFGKK